MFSHDCPTGDLSYDDQVRGERVGRIAYLRGRPASEWIRAVSRGRTAREQAPLAGAAA
jgi:hypothetical protein